MGRGFARALRALLGGKRLRKAKDSWGALRSEFKAGRKEGEETPEAVLEVEADVVRSESLESDTEGETRNPEEKP